MTAYGGLLRKEFYITRFWFYVWLIFIFIAFLTSFMFADRYNEPIVTAGFMVAITVFHFGFLPIMVLSSLKLEGKTQLWLYNPQSSKTLLLAKISVPLIYQIISQLIVIILTAIVFMYLSSHHINVDHLPIARYIFIHIFMILTGLYISCWLLFYWCFYHSLGKYPRLKKLRWLFIILIFILDDLVESLLMKIAWFKMLFHKWEHSLFVSPRFHYEVSNHTWNMQFSLEQLPIIPFFIFAAVAIVLYFISCWLLDRKVEV